MNSLRRRLIATLCSSCLLVGLICAAYSWWQSRRDTNALLDYQMEQIAALAAAQPLQDVPAPVTPAPLVDDDAEDRFQVTVRDASGKLAYATDPTSPVPALKQLGFQTIVCPGGSFRVYAAESKGRQIVVAQSSETRREIAAASAISSLLPMALMLPVLTIVIGLVIRSQLRPLREIAHEVSRRPPLALERISVAGLPKEVQPLIVEINNLLKRLRQALDNEQRFIADAAHALRTPLGAMQLQADVLGGSSDAAENARRIEDLRLGIRRAVRLADHLLALARTDSAGSPGERSELDGALLEAYELYAPIAAMRGIDFVLEAGSKAMVAAGTRHILLILGNLLDNALRYTPGGGEVRLRAYSTSDALCIDLIDEGSGLADTELEKVFERFYRSEGDTTSGSGLGLTVVRSIALQLGGDVHLRNRDDRSGLVASLRLPHPPIS